MKKVINEENWFCLYNPYSMLLLYKVSTYIQYIRYTYVNINLCDLNVWNRNCDTIIVPVNKWTYIGLWLNVNKYT